MPSGTGTGLNTREGEVSIHCHGTAKLKNDSGLCELTKVALKGVLADNLIKHHGNSTTPELEIGN